MNSSLPYPFVCTQEKRHVIPSSSCLAKDRCCSGPGGFARYAAQFRKSRTEPMLPVSIPTQASIITIMLDDENEPSSSAGSSTILDVNSNGLGGSTDSPIVLDDDEEENKEVSLSNALAAVEPSPNLYSVDTSPLSPSKPSIGSFGPILPTQEPSKKRWSRAERELHLLLSANYQTQSWKNKK